MGVILYAVQLHLLGQPCLVWQNKSQPVVGYGALVLAWLALHQRGDALPARLRLTRALWPDEDDDQARRRLTQTLYRLKRETPELEAHLVGDAHSIGLEGVEVDALAFEQHIHTLDHWQLVLESYKGDLLEGYDAPWLEEWRAGLRELFLGGLQKAVHHFESVEDAASAIRWGQRWVAADSLSEEAHTCLIRLFANQNRNAEALAQYQTLEQILERELGTAPRRETQAYVHSLLPSNAAHSYRSLVGRSKELRALADQLSALKAGKGGVVVLEGEPGLGKTRLLEEVAQLAKWHHLEVLRGRTSEQHETPYAPLDSAMQGAGALLEVASPLMRETLKPLLEASSEAALNSSSDAVGAALERWLLKLNQPLVVLLDDLQWAGDLFWALLPVLSKMARQQHVLLVLTHRSQELQAEPFALKALTHLRREGSLLHLELEGLSLDECAALAKALGKTLEANELDRLYRLSSGNPLVLSEFLLGSGSAERLEGLLKARFERLDDPSRQALQAASVLGNVFEQGVWAAMLDFVPPTQRLIEARFLHQDQAKLSFQHDLIRSLIYQGQSQEQRQRWHAIALKAISGSAEPAAILAMHAREADMYAECAPLYLRAAEEALSFEALAQARKFLEQAQRYMPQETQPADAIKLRLLNLVLGFVANPSSEALNELDELEAAARKAGLSELVFDILSLRLKALEAKGDVQGYQATAEVVLAESKTVGLEREVRELSVIAQTLAGRFYDPGAALPLAQRAELLTSAHQLPRRFRFSTLSALMTCHMRQQNLSALEQCLVEAETLFDQYPELVGFERVLRSNQGLLYLYRDRFEEAIEAFKKYLEAGRVTGHTASVSVALQNLILTLKGIGQYQEALVWAEEMAELAHHQGQLDANKSAHYRYSLAELLAILGRPDEGEALLQPIMAQIESGAGGDGTINARTIMASIRKFQGRYQEGLELLQKNIGLLANNPANQINFQLLAAEMAWLAGLHPEARQRLGQVAPHANSLSKAYGLIWWYVRYVIEGCSTDLEEAWLMALGFASGFKNPAIRRDWFEAYRIKAIRELWEQQDRQTIAVELPVVGADDSSRVAVTWTLDSGASDKEHFLANGKVGLRHHRLRRLVLEAAAGGAVPTQPDLAQALGVTLRTIESDLATLREKGVELKTLGMKGEVT